LNGRFALSRSFDANAPRIFRKFEMFAYDFIAKMRAPCRTRLLPARVRKSALSAANFTQFRPGKSYRAPLSNRPFTMRRAVINFLSFPL
jgi:hypothetical protein